MEDAAGDDLLQQQHNASDDANRRALPPLRSGSQTGAWYHPATPSSHLPPSAAGSNPTPATSLSDLVSPNVFIVDSIFALEPDDWDPLACDQFLNGMNAEGDGEKKLEWDSGDDMGNSRLNFFDDLNSSEVKREDLNSRASGTRTSGDNSENEIESRVDENGGSRIKSCPNHGLSVEKREGIKRSAAGDPGPIGTGTRHCRSLSMDGFMDKLDVGEESPKLPPSPGFLAAQTPQANSKDGASNVFSLEFGNGEFNPAEMKKTVANKSLAKMGLKDPKRVKRILIKQRASWEERNVKHAADLKRMVDTLETEATPLSAELTLLQRDSAGLTSQNNELKCQFQFMEQKAQLRDAMASESEISRRDCGWNYGYLANPSNKNNVTCIFCGKEAKGGIYRLKQHLVGGFQNITACPKCPEYVKEEIREYMMKKKKEREQISSVPDFDDVALENEEKDEIVVVDYCGKRIANVRSSANKKPRQASPRKAFYTREHRTVTQSGKEKQTTIDDAYKKELREKACADIARWMYEAAIPFNAVKLDSFRVALESVGRYGVGMKPPNYHEVTVRLLKKEVAHINDIMKSHKEEWARTGCSILFDGWQYNSEKILISFLVNCSKGSMFIESIDASSYMKTGEKLFQLLQKKVEEVGAANVVQVITNNESSYVSAGRLLEAKYPNLYWRPCAAHCVDLMLEDIGKLPTMMETIKRAIELNSYIYNYSGVVNMMRRFTKQKNLLRPAITRFATSFLTLSNIHKQCDNLRKMFTSEEWTSSKWAKEQAGERAAQIVSMSSFWNGIVYALKVTSPLIRVLRLVNGEKKPAIGYIYEAMDQAKEAIATSFKEREREREDKYKEIFEIIDQRWKCQLHHPLHATGYFLNPEYFYDKPTIEQDVEVMTGLYKCIQRLVPDLEEQDKIMDGLFLYKKADGLFGNPMAIRHRKTMAPGEWWSAYGSSTPSLQSFAIKVLSLECSSSRCGQNLSVFEHVHSKRRYRLAQARWNDLAYIKCNQALHRRYKSRDTIDPISLKDMDDSNEWLTGRIEEECAEDDLVFDDDDHLTWGDDAIVAGVQEERFNIRSRVSMPIGRAMGSSSSAQHFSNEIKDDTDEEDDEGYNSYDGDDDANLMLDEDDDCIL